MKSVDDIAHDAIREIILERSSEVSQQVKDYFVGKTNKSDRKSQKPENAASDQAVNGRENDGEAP